MDERISQTQISFASNKVRIANIPFLRPYIEPKPKMYALCMGLHRRLGADSPLRWLNVDMMHEIAKYVYC
jgi:hypothetical protein